MSDKQRGFGYGTIVTMLIVAMVTGLSGNVWVNSSQVPVIQTELSHQSEALKAFIEQSQTQNAVTAGYIQQNSIIVTELKTSNSLTALKLQVLNSKCDDRFSICKGKLDAIK